MNRKRTDLDHKRLLFLSSFDFVLMSFGGFKLQAEEKKNFRLTLSAIIKKNRYYYMIPGQTVSLRERSFSLHISSDRLLDPAGRILNAKDTFHILPIQTRLGLKINGPRAWELKLQVILKPNFSDV
jgi:hypothetical protein